MPFTPLEQQLINQLQLGLPVVVKPFEQVAAQLNSTEQQVLSALECLTAQGVITRFGPMFDAVNFGGAFTLAALAVPEERFEHVTEIVNSFEQVAHNYQRNHHYNMWFVIATETQAEIADVITRIEQQTGLEVLNLPKLHEFYVQLYLPVTDDDLPSALAKPANAQQRKSNQAVVSQLSNLERQYIIASQQGLALCSQPFLALAKQLQLTETKVIELTHTLLARGVIRRIALVPNHYKLGYRFNGMTTWNIPDEFAYQAGELIGQLPFVSHCYLRPRHISHWHYNLFAMIHAKSQNQLADYQQQLVELLTPMLAVPKEQAHLMLISTKILKKTGLRLKANTTNNTSTYHKAEVTHV